MGRQKLFLAVNEMHEALALWWSDEEGLTTVEYALLLALIVVVAAASWSNFGRALADSTDGSLEVMQAAITDEQG